MRSFLALLTLFIGASAVRGAVPHPALAEALKHFRADPPPGWSFTLASAGGGQSMVERYDASKPEFDRWSLVQKDGRPPTPDEAREYAESRSRRSRGGTAPKVIEQLDLATLEKTGEHGERVTFRCRVKPGDDSDNVAGFLRATIVVHQPSHTIESLQLGSTGEFSPSVVMKISEMATAMTYSLPAAGRPSLPQKVATRVRGRAFFFKSLDAEMTMTFSDYSWVGKK
jgi:hypothetical protein